MKNPAKYTDLLSTLIFVLILFSGLSVAQDTFSIVSVDIVTGEVGSTGASCVKSSSSYPHGAAILSDVIPGVGGIHTQASYLPDILPNAHNMMLAGNSPQEIIDWLISNDAGGNPTVRQYGIVDLNGRLILSRSVNDQIESIDHSEFNSAGIYLCRVLIEGRRPAASGKIYIN